MRKGFTLVELLIVLAVIAALMAVATPMALSAVKTAKASQVAQNLNALKTAVENYVSAEHDITNVSTKTLMSKGYISTITGKYEITAPTSWSNDGTAKFVISYNGGDVDYAAVSKQNPYVIQGTGDIPVLEATVVKWW